VTFGVRTISIPVAGTRAYDETEWRDTLVLVAAGELEVECLSGRCERFRRGAFLSLAGLPLRALRNPGGETTRLAAVSRR
jgi:hypothetical protein